jgi:hypothetical protein
MTYKRTLQKEHALKDFQDFVIKAEDNPKFRFNIIQAKKFIAEMAQ